MTLGGPCWTTTVTVAVSQFVGLAISQMVYSMVWLPGAVPAATLTLPSAFTVNIAVGLEERIRPAGATTLPFSRSFARTLLSGIGPVVPSTTLYWSSTASKVFAPTSIYTVAVAQTEGSGRTLQT